MTESILNFQAMTETTDQELAVCYLTGNNWDLTKAVEQYISEKAVSQFASTPTKPIAPILPGMPTMQPIRI